MLMLLMMVVWVVTVHERVQVGKFGQLTAQNLRVPSKSVYHHPRSLLIFREISNLEEPTRSRRIHEEIWRTVQLDNEAALLSRVHVAVLEVDVLDVTERVLDLVSRRVIVDVVGHTRLIGRVEDDEVHGILADSAPRSNLQSAA